MKVQNCIVCGNEKNIDFCVKDSGVYVACTNCGHVYLKNIESIFSQKRRNNSDKTHHVSEEKLKWDYSDLKDKIVFKPMLKKIESLTAKGSLLDLGCSNGAFVRAAKKYGWDACGVELRKKSIETAQRHGIKVYTEPLEKLVLPSDSFSVVTMWQVLEHLQDPNLVLKEIFRILKSNGILVLSTPNIKSIGWRFLHADWPPIEPKVHFNLFDKIGLKRLLKKSGFDTFRIDTLDLQPATVRQVKRKILGYKVEKQSSIVASLVSSSSLFQLRLLFFIRFFINVSLRLFDLGEDLYGYFRKSGVSAGRGEVRDIHKY